MYVDAKVLQSIGIDISVLVNVNANANANANMSVDLNGRLSIAVWKLR